jgi:large subunit ribosomal protein L9
MKGHIVMKVYLLKDVPKIGMAGEVLKVADGFGQNFLLPRKLAVEVTAQNESFYAQREKIVEHRKEVVATKTSMLAEKIGSLKLTLKRKMHDDGKLYGAVNALEIVDLLAEKGISVSKSQIDLDKSIKTKGSYEVTIKLSSSLKPTIKLTIIPE